MRRLYLFTASALAFSLTCEARVCFPNTAEKNVAVQYTINLVTSFQWAKEGLLNIPDMQSQPTSLFDLEQSIRDGMLGLKRASERYECSATLVAPYMKSNNKAVQASAVGATTAYRRLIGVNSELIQTLVDVLNKKAARSPQGDFANKLTDFSVRSDRAWDLLVTATTADTWALVVIPKNGGPLTTMNMTSSQWSDLNKRLEQSFEDVVKRDIKELPLDLAVWALHHAINQPEAKFLDQQ